MNDNNGKELIEDVIITDIQEPSGNVISFNNKKEEEAKQISFKDFLEAANKDVENIKHFIFIGIRNNDEVTVSAKADSNLHLFWIVKKFLRYLEDIIFG